MSTGVARLESAKHTAGRERGPVGSATLTAVEGYSLRLPRLPCSGENFYVKSPDLQILAPVISENILCKLN